MYYYKTIIQYEGTRYAGFQWQNGILTVQQEFNQALGKICADKFSTMAASRTDTGVHAFDQIVKITSAAEIDCSVFLESFNQFLPADIRCLKIESCLGSFRPSVQSKSKEYRYLFTNRTRFEKSESMFVANISNELDISLINACLNMLIGTHDFSNFSSSGSNVKSTIRTITNCSLSIINPHDILNSSELFEVSESLQECYELKIEADGFIKQMIRHIVSALWMVGSKKLSIEDFKNFLNSPKMEKQLWKVAPPNGLFLYRINY